MSVPNQPNRIVLLVGLVVLLVLPLGAASADEEPPGVRLSRARDKELDQRNYAQALDLYEALLQEADLDATVRGAAMLGAGRCHRALGQPAEAEKSWEAILADRSLPLDVHEKAEKALNELRAARSEVDPGVARAEEQRRLAEQRKARTKELLEQARRELTEGRYEFARKLCLDALSWVPDSDEAAALLTEIEKATPDRAELVRTLLKFANTTSIRTFLRLKRSFEELDDEGRTLYKAEDYKQADKAFRRAIQLIDESTFFEDLQNERAHAIRWLRLTIEKAEETGTRLGPVPQLPEPGTVGPSFQRRFYDLLSEVFSARPGEDDPLVLYDLQPKPPAHGTSEPGLAHGSFPKGIKIARGESGLRRAAWAEQWIRKHVGTGWTTSTPSGRLQGPPRILDRFGDILILQHTRGVHKEVQKLLDGFADTPPPVALDVAVVAATTPAVLRIAERLGAVAGVRESGEDLLVSNLLFEECTRLIQHLEGVEVLGTARMTLTDPSSGRLDITQHADYHPAYQGLPPPTLHLAEEEARFGLRLDVYAEDLAQDPSGQRAALEVHATTRVPLGTVVVPKPNAEGRHARLPLPMAQQVQTSVRIVPHAGTLLFLGLANPFAGTSATHPSLVLLVGVRPASGRGARAPIPDPPRSPGRVPPATGSGGLEEREYDLGPLALEVDDALLDKGWPLKPASDPVPVATLRKARERYLASNLASTWSTLVEPGEESPVEVRGRRASANLLPKRHAQLQTAVAKFRSQETDLYQVEVLSAETDEATLSGWLQTASVRAFTAGTYLVTGSESLGALEGRLKSPGGGGSLYSLQSRLLARATQKVAAKNLHILTIVEDLRFWRHTDGRTQRLIPVLGTAEEGIVVLVRPQRDGQGRRWVTVDAQASRLRDLEQLLLPEIELSTARITVARHFPPQRRQVAAPLGDDEAVVLTLPSPEGSGRVIAILVRVRKMQ